jgi:hypothetical protein
MNDQRKTFVGRVLNVFGTEGIKGISKRIKNRLRWSEIHLLVYRYCGTDSALSAFPTGVDPLVVRAQERAQRFLNSLEFKQLTAADIGELDELSEIDPWKIPKSVTLEKLQDGWNCYVAKHKDRIIANTWTKSGPGFYEPFLKRSFTLADDEAYGWRGFCVPDFRGRGVLPWLSKSSYDHLALTAGVRSTFGLVRVNNPAMWRSLLQDGGSLVGRAGFIEVFGLRLHYLWGKHAFSLTKKRIFIQRQKHQ